ncbi:MAG: DUF3179 domain-containing protein [Chitinophagaceae bacterium]|nr:DUF3179 domain-containing protein [Chitinophagaceae bacterium]
MKNIFRILLFPCIMFMNLGCAKNTSLTNINTNGNDSVSASSNTWLIPRERVVDGGPGKDGIPALVNPIFINVSVATYLKDNDMVIGYRNGDDIRAYPHAILNWHEIVNDDVNGNKLAIVYCPLTGTAVGWSRIISGSETTFGVSGLLYNTNIIPYDRKTNSNWSQMLFKAVNGPLKDTGVNSLQLIETSWKTWKEMFPFSKVLTVNTGYSRNYAVYPYGDYRVNNNVLIFNIDPDDNRLPRKERVLGIIKDGKSKVYRFSSITAHDGIIQDVFNGYQLVIAGNEQKNIMVAFINKLPDGSTPNFVLDKSGKGLLSDQFGNIWDAFGVAISGPMTGQKLSSPEFVMGYWLAFGAFYPGVKIF